MSRKLGRSIATLALCALHVGAQAQAWPARTIRIVVPFTPGSGTDIIARTVTERLSPQLGQPIVIENRPGAGGTIGAAVVAKSGPDGYTLFVHSSSYTVTPSTYKDLPYDTLRDLTGVVPLALLPNVLVMAPSKGIRSVKELVAATSAAMNSRRGPGSFLSRRKKPTGRGGRASSARSRFVGAESRPSAAEESNCRDKGRRVSEPIARAAGASRVFSVSTSSFTVFVTS